jgi:flagellar biosynthesis protein FlhA
MEPVNRDRGNAITAFGMMGVILLLILPLPPAILDMMLALSISIALVVLVASLYVERPADFTVFPALLLATTLFRLALNVGSTRLILLRGDEGPTAAGDVIATFGTFVVGGNYIVGMIIFLILVIINFMVVTKGAGRIAEVAARFTLDAMPGKQMAIDADLGAGMIDESEARKRRDAVSQEADFYGAMDGASKFVRGDAIAGLLVTGINIIAGLIIGVGQQGMELSDAAANYTILTIGDGLVSQMPALLISVAAGIVVSRAGSKQVISAEVKEQLFNHAGKLNVVAVVIVLFAMIPGMPTLSFLGLAAFFFIIGNQVSSKKKVEEEEGSTLERLEDKGLSERQRLERLLPLDAIALEVSFPLVPLVDAHRDGDLLDRIQAVRKQVALQYGIILPQVHIRDNIELEGGLYRVLVKGVAVAEGTVRYGQYLGMDPGTVFDPIDGEKTTEPAFGLDAIWVTSEDRDDAELRGYTVVDCSTVIATHLTEVVKSHIDELFGDSELDDIIRITAEHSPKLVEDLIPAKLSRGELLRVMRNLLREGVSVRDMRTVLETLADRIHETKNTDILAEYVRYRLGSAICSEIADDSLQIQGLVLDGVASQAIRESLTAIDSEVHVGLQPNAARGLLSNLSDQMEQFAMSGRQPVLVVPAEIRRPVRDFLARHLGMLTVLSHREIPARYRLEAIGEVSLKAAA